MGFAKSEMANHFFNSKGIIPYVKTLGAGTTLDSLFGGIDINLFTNGLVDEEATNILRAVNPTASPVYIKKPGTIEYLVENSFMNSEYVILEEAFDAPDFVLESFKDILTSKMLRNGSQLFKIKTKMIIVCTNRERAHIAEDSASLKALMERFPLEIKVEWPNHDIENYKFFFQESFNEKNDLLATICGELGKNKIIISPRTAVKALRGFNESGKDFLQFLADFNSEKAKEITNEAIKKYKTNAKLFEIIDLGNKIIQEYDSLTFNLDLETAKRIISLLKDLKAQADHLKTVKRTDENMKLIDDVNQTWEKKVLEISEKIDQVCGLSVN